MRTRWMWNTSMLTVALTLGAYGCSSCDEDGETGGTGGPSEEAEAGGEIFARNCTTCHTIGEGESVGPDLRGIGERREHDWLVRWIDDPIDMAANDPIGQEIFAQYRNVPMPDMNLSAEEIEQVLAYIDHESEGEAATPEEAFQPLAEADFDTAKRIFFDRCAGCHGTLRAGATGPNIQPERTREIGTRNIERILTNGTPGGMPSWGRMGILTEEEIGLLARFVQMDPPEPPQRPLSEIRESWELIVPVADRPTEVQTERDWENYFGVVLRDAGQVAIIDGDSHEMVTILDTGFAVHILRSSASGRYFLAIGRDGRVTMIDLWPETPQIVARVQGCIDARSVDASHHEGFEDRFVIEGCYWPSQYVVFDGGTLEPLSVTAVQGETVDTHEALDEVRVASIVASHHAPVWLLSLKESGHVGIVDYSQEGFPMVRRIGAERFLHDGGFDHTGRYFMVAANTRNRMVVIDAQEQTLVTTFETGTRPHPGRGANWEDPEYGWVNATTHIGQGRFSIYGADPANHPEHAWSVVRELELDGTGSLFIKTHPNSPWVWLDFSLNNDEDGTRQICVYSKADGEIHRCWQAADHGRVVHFEYNRQGTQVWVSVWDREGEIIVYDDRSLEEVTRITGDWLVTPTGKFNAYNTTHNIY